MTIINAIAVLIILATIGFGAYKYVARKRAIAEKAEVQAIMEESNELHRNQAIEVSERLRGQVTNHKIHWLTMSDKGSTRTYVRYEDLLDSEELTLAERRTMESIMAHLARVREFRDENVYKPKGYIVHLHPLHGKLIEYTPGIKRVGDRNKMGIRVERNENGLLFIRELRISLDLGNQLSDVYRIANADGSKNQEEVDKFQANYVDNDDVRPSFDLEITRYNQITAEIRNFNLHLPNMVFDDKQVAIEYRSAGVTPRTENESYKNAPEISFTWEI